MPLAPRRVFHVSYLIWSLVVIAAWLSSEPLGHDEAAYAVGGDLLAHGHASPWLHRSVGMHLLALPGVLAGGAELALRVPAVLFALAFPFALRRVGRPISERAAAWSLPILALMPEVIGRGHTLLSDLPAATCVLVGLATLVEELEREDGPRLRLALAAPWLAGAFYLRYASAAPVAAILVLLLVVYARRLAARPGALVGFAAALALLLVPHVVQAITLTGAPLGILRFSSSAAGRHDFGEGLVTYLSPARLGWYGLAAPVLLAGALGGAFLRAPGGRRVPVVYAFVAFAQVIALGLLVHAEPRYIYVAIALLAVLGVEVLARLAERITIRARHASAVLLGALLVVPVAAGARTHVRERAWRTHVIQAAEEIRRDAAGRPCLIVSRRFTQLMWYSGCASSGQAPLAGVAAGQRVYVVFFPRTEAPFTPADLAALERAPVEKRVLADDPERYRMVRVLARGAR
jgi:hypothetical protein